MTISSAADLVLVPFAVMNVPPWPLAPPLSGAFSLAEELVDGGAVPPGAEV